MHLGKGLVRPRPVINPSTATAAVAITSTGTVIIFTSIFAAKQRDGRLLNQRVFRV